MTYFQLAIPEEKLRFLVERVEKKIHADMFFP